MPRKITIEDAADMTALETLELIELLWDSLADDPVGMPLSEEERGIVEERLEAYRRDPSATVSWEEAKRRALLPDGHADILDERLDELERNPSDAVPADEVCRRIQGR